MEPFPADHNILVADINDAHTRIARGDVVLSGLEQLETPQNYPDMVTMLECVGTKLFRRQRIDAVAVAIAGTPKSGQLAEAGRLKDFGYCEQPMAKDLTHVLRVSSGDHIILLNNCVASANAERRAPYTTESSGAFFRLNTSLNGALWLPFKLKGGDPHTPYVLPDEPGHRFLRDGAQCGCGREGCLEAFVSGAGIEKNYGVRAEDLPHDDVRWSTIKTDLAKGTTEALLHYHATYRTMPSELRFIGSVATSGPDILRDLMRNLLYRLGRYAPSVKPGHYGEYAGLHGARFAAEDYLAS